MMTWLDRLEQGMSDDLKQALVDAYPWLRNRRDETGCYHGS